MGPLRKAVQKGQQHGRDTANHMLTKLTSIKPEQIAKSIKPPRRTGGRSPPFWGHFILHHRVSVCLCGFLVLCFVFFFSPSVTHFRQHTRASRSAELTLAVKLLIGTACPRWPNAPTQPHPFTVDDPQFR